MLKIFCNQRKKNCKFRNNEWKMLCRFLNGCFFKKNEINWPLICGLFQGGLTLGNFCNVKCRKIEQIKNNRMLLAPRFLIENWENPLLFQKAFCLFCYNAILQTYLQFHVDLMRGSQYFKEFIYLNSHVHMLTYTILKTLTFFTIYNIHT